MQQIIPPFHVAVPVYDVELARAFYRDILECEEGRSDEKWVDFNLFGHQFVIHHKEKLMDDIHTNPVDGNHVPVPHYGVVLPWDQWHEFRDMLIRKGVQFIIDPYIRFKGKTGEQATMFFSDPCGNALEFKAFKNMSQLFAK